MASSPSSALPSARAALGLGAALLLASAWCLAPWHAARPWAERAPLAAVLCDVSPSVTRTRPLWRAWLAGELAQQAEQARELGAELVVLAYARDRTRLDEPRNATRPGAWSAALERLPDAADALADDAQASDLWGAAAALSELSAGRELASLTWIGDGEFSGRDPAGLLGGLRARAQRWSFRAVGACELDDLALVDLELPRSTQSGAPLVARAWLRLQRGSRSAGASAAVLEIALATPAGPLAWTQRVDLTAAGAQPWPLELALGPAQPGTTRLDLRARLQPHGDAVPENDRLRADTRAGAALSVAVFSSAATRAQAAEFGAALGLAGGLAVRQCSADELAASLARDDVLVSFDAPFDELPAQALASFLRAGGGWLTCAGAGVLARATRRAPAAELSPLDYEPDGVAARDVVLLLDGSGSMQAPVAGAGTSALDEARAAAVALADMAAENERVLVRWFGAQLEEPIAVTSDLEFLLARRTPGGATDIPGSLARLASQHALETRPSLALLVSDGRDQARDEAALAGLRERLRVARVELAVIAVGPDPDLAYLRLLVGPQGRLEVAGPEADLAALLVRAAGAERLREGGPFDVAYAQPLGALASSALGVAADSAGPPAARSRYLRARLRAGAEPAWVSASGPGAGEVLLAVARQGLGATAALATLPGPEDAAELSGLVRWLGSARPDQRPFLRLTAGRLELEDVPAHWPAEILARPAADGAAQAAQLLPPAETLVDPRDRRVGPWPWAAPPDGIVELRSAALAPEQAPLAVLLAQGPPTAEFAWPPDRIAVELLGPGPEAATVAHDPERGSHPLGLPLLGLGLALLTWGGLALGRPARGDQGAGGAGR